MGQLLTIKDLMSNNYPEQKWTVDRLIPANAITILSGEPGSFKTYLLLETALAAVENRPLFDQFEATASGVLVIDEENGEALLQQRLRQLGASKDELPIYFYSLQDFILNDKNVEAAIKDCKEHNIDLVMIDSLVRIHTGDENRAGDMAAVFKQLKRFTINGIAVLVTHHNRKPGKDSGNARHDMRGSSDILASVDSHLSLRRDADELILSQPKQRYAKELSSIRLNVTDKEDVFSFEYVGNMPNRVSKTQQVKADILAILANNIDKPLNTGELSVALEECGSKVNDKKLKEILDVLVEDKQIVRGGGTGNTKSYKLNP